MDGSPRRSTQANRQARRQSPYARPSNAAPQATPSRLRSVLSYLSPFRSSSKAQDPREQEQEDEGVEDEVAGEEDASDSADEAAQFALHGRAIARESSAGIHLPASPTPVHQIKRHLKPSNLSTSFSMPDLASITSPRAPGNFARTPTTGESEYTVSEFGGGGGATEELARFFREKAERGEEGLTAIEQAGVMHLMQQAQSVPTAFTPNFANTSNTFSPAPQSQAGSALQTGTTSTYRRKRPLYVGAGYSSRRRKTNVSAGGISKSQSEGSLANLAASSSKTDGKRRRTQEDEMEEDIPVASLDDVLVSAPVASTSVSSSTNASEKAQDKLKSKPSLSRFTGTSTPAKPSPLWQVSKADTPSPSPPRKPSTKATGAANLMLDVIQQVDAANPAPKSQVAPGKEAILNPYDNVENPLTLASKRVPRSSGSGRSKSSATRSSARTKAVEVDKPKEKEISPLEQLERTMPAEYRRETNSKRSKPDARPAATSTAPTPQPKATVEKKQTKTVEVVELLSSDVEEEDADVDMSPAPAAAKTTEKTKEAKETKTSPPFGFTSAPTASAKVPSFGSSTSTGFSFGPTSSSPSAPAAPSFSLKFGAPAVASVQNTPPRDTLSPSPSALTPPPADRPSSPKASLPPTPPPVSKPFVFALAPPVSVPTTTANSAAPTTTSTASVKDQVAALPTTSLPVHEFNFSSIANSAAHAGASDDASVKAVKDLARNMGKGELPTFVF
ncbi:hypothetical protein JCM11491_003477 [Sporobolomyces phaffii]